MKSLKVCAALAVLVLASMNATVAFADDDSAKVIAGLSPEAMKSYVNHARSTNWAIGLGAGLGAGLTIIGAAYGISLIASRAVESMARQPEVAGTIQGAMVVTAAFIEGVTFFSLIVCILILVLA